MGKINQGILGGVSGRVGSVVGASWKGVPTIRVYQPNVSNPQTSAQTAQRTAFSGITKIASSLLTPLIKGFWDRFAVKQSGYNAFIAANKLANGGFQSDAANIVFSKGKLSATKVFTAKASPAGYEFDETEAPVTRYDLDTDEFYGILYNSTKREYFSARLTDSTGEVPATRGSVGSSYLLYTALPSTWDSDTDVVKGAGVFRRADGSYVSECVGLADPY
jgi:hypothetical protein